MKYKSIVIEGNPNEFMTSNEKDEAMLKSIEKEFGTGPIISEAREVILQLARNIQVRDLILESMGMNVDQREKVFQMINDAMDKRDNEILEKRKSK